MSAFRAWRRFQYECDQFYFAKREEDLCLKNGRPRSELSLDVSVALKDMLDSLNDYELAVFEEERREEKERNRRLHKRAQMSLFGD